MSINRVEFYKEIYYKEHERRNSLTNEIALQGTVLVALITGVYVLFTGFENTQLWLIRAYQIILSVEVLLILLTAFFLMQSYFDFSKGG